MKTALKLPPDHNILNPQYQESRRILVVDDENEILQAYKDILSPKSNVVALKSSRSISSESKPVSTTDVFEVVAVSSGEEAVEAVRKSVQEGKPFAIGFFDVLLKGGIDGIEAVRQIHDIDKELYAVLVTAYQDRHVNSIQKVFGPEFQDRWDYLNKPFSEGEILQKARSMVSMWNIRRKIKLQQEYMDEMKSQLSMNEKNMTVAAVARSVGHEFGNVLFQIMGRAELCQNASPEEMKKGLETILLASEHAAKVLQRFKNLSNPKTESPTFGMIDISKPIDDTLLLLDHELHRRSITVEKNWTGTPMAYGHHSALVQVFMNLIINATHAMGQDGQIVISATPLAEDLEIKIKDSGPGIDPKNLDSIFEAFFTTKGRQGTGLGLCVCKEIIEISHGGSLTVSNHPEGGAEFKILLPLQPILPYEQEEKK